jgi:ATP/maltotriose-dependent transcriptional regulator MalT
MARGRNRGMGERLVGREEQVAALEEALAAAQAGESSLLAISGEGGIGKSRLLEELRRRAEERGLLVLTGRAAEFEGDLPFSVWIDALDDHLASMDVDDPDELGGVGLLSEAAGILPSLRGLAGQEAPNPLGDERHRTHVAVRRLLERLAARQPLALLLDDLHWADHGSVELLASIVRRRPAGPLLLALAHRPRPVAERLFAAIDRAERDGVLRRLELDPLTRDEVRELLGDDVGSKTLELLHGESGGNPFYIEQLARAETSTADGGAARRLQELPGVPPAVTAALADEVRGLGRSARLVLDAASVAGDPFECDLAAAIADVPEDDALAGLDELVASSLVHTTDVPRRFAFRHPLVRRAVYESTRRGWRITAHARAADALAARDEPAATLAHHVEQSARDGDLAAVELLQTAGDDVAARTPATAVRWFEAALRLLPPGEEGDRRRPGLLISLATSLAAAGRYEETRATLVGLIEALPPDAIGPRVSLTGFCAAIEHLLGRHAEAHERLLTTLEGLPDRRSPDALTLMVELATDAFYGGRFDDMEQWAAEALAAAHAEHDDAHAAAASGLLALAFTLTGRIEDAVRQQREAAELLDSITDEELAIRPDAATQLAWAEIYLECYGQALKHARRGIAVARATGQGQYVSITTIAEAMALGGHGRTKEGMELLAGAVESARLSDNRQLLSLALLNYAIGAWTIGDPEGGLRAAEESVELARSLDDSVLAAYASGSLGIIMAESERAAEVPALLHAAGGGPDLPLLPAPWRPTYLEALARGELAAGRLEEARRAAQTAADLGARLGLSLTNAHAKRAQAAVALAEGDPERAAEHALESAATADTGIPGAEIAAARARALAGRAFAAAGDRDAAIEQFERAEADLDRLGAARFRDEVVHELRRLGRRPRHRPAPGDPESDGIAALSERERQVAELVADRRMNKEIAAELFLSEKTVESHLRNVFMKLGVSSRVEVARVVDRARVTQG